MIISKKQSVLVILTIAIVVIFAGAIGFLVKSRLTETPITNQTVRAADKAAESAEVAAISARKTADDTRKTADSAAVSSKSADQSAKDASNSLARMPQGTEPAPAAK